MLLSPWTRTPRWLYVDNVSGLTTPGVTERNYLLPEITHVRTHSPSSLRPAKPRYAPSEPPRPRMSSSARPQQASSASQSASPPPASSPPSPPTPPRTTTAAASGVPSSPSFPLMDVRAPTPLDAGPR